MANAEAVKAVNQTGLSDVLLKVGDDLKKSNMLS